MPNGDSLAPHQIFNSEGTVGGLRPIVIGHCWHRGWRTATAGGSRPWRRQFCNTQRYPNTNETAIEEGRR
eukprot:8912542-Pyramimonas_sp.AAC.1